MIIENCAVFFGRSKRNVKVNVEHDGDEVIITNRITHDVISRYPVIEVAKAGMAWDITDQDGETRRMTAQQGCGCTGMKSYSVDEGYSGRF